MGLVQRDLGQLAAAAASLRRAIELEPGFVEAHCNLGNVLLPQGATREAEACYRKALALRPGDAESHQNLGNALMSLGQMREAEASFRQALALKPDFVTAHSNLIFLIDLDEHCDTRAQDRKSTRLNSSHT